MEQQLRFIPLRSRTDALWAETWHLYEHSFPACERWRAENYDRAFGDPAFEADAVCSGGEFVGLLFHWDTGPCRYIEHLAVASALRGRRMGSHILSAFCAKARRVVLEIDPPVDDVSIRRQHFYERIGFVTNAYDYIHPSFTRPFHAHQLVLMSRPDPLTKEEARLFADFVREHVLRYSDHLQPELPRIL